MTKHKAKLQVALEGPINGCTDSEAHGWREATIKLLEPYVTFHNPMDFDCRGKEVELEEELVAYDIAGLEASDIILVNASAPGWGTAMAVQMCYDQRKTIISVCAGRVSPWLRNRSTAVVSNMEDAHRLLVKILVGRIV